MGYEAVLLRQLPAVLVTALHLFPTIIMHCSEPIQHDQPEVDREAEVILSHRTNYNMEKVFGKIDGSINFKMNYLLKLLHGGLLYEYSSLASYFRFTLWL